MPTKNFEIVLIPSQEGYAVAVPGLPGCWSQGETEAEAIANIKDAIFDYLDVTFADFDEGYTRSIEVDVPCLKLPELTTGVP